MKKLTLALTVALALVLSTIISAGAITNGVPDHGRHPFVGLAVFDVLDQNGKPVPSHRCSASLLSPTIVLTAGHCTDGTLAARLWFDEVVQANPEYPFSGSSSYDGTPYTFQNFCTGCGNGLPGFAAGDVGIIVLTEPVPRSVVSTYAELPDKNLVNTLKNKTSVDFVGYGVQHQAQVSGNQLPQPAPFYRWTGPKERLYAPSELVSGNFFHSDAFLRLAMNPSGGSDGICFGDSGGPDLLGGTNTVLAVNSYITNSNCSGVGYAFRIDTPAVLEWINSFFATK